MSEENNDLKRIDERIKERSASARDKLRASFDPNVPLVDAGKFSQQISDLAVTLRNKIEREGPALFPYPALITDVGMILRQLTWTYRLLCWINADDTRFEMRGYQTAYSFVSLPLVRTIIDGFYNCTALLDDPSRSRIFRISGFFRLRMALREDEAKYGTDPAWQIDFQARRATLQYGLALEHLTDADLDDKRNKWPLLGGYLDTPPDTPHKRLLRQLSYGFWREYSSISHASYDGLIQIFHAIAPDMVPHAMRTNAHENMEHRHFAMHYARAAVLMLSLLTEIQNHFKFDGANVDGRLRDTWNSMLEFYEAKELYDFRYNALLRDP